MDLPKSSSLPPQRVAQRNAGVCACAAAANSSSIATAADRNANRRKKIGAGEGGVGWGMGEVVLETIERVRANFIGSSCCRFNGPAAAGRCCCPLFTGNERD